MASSRANEPRSDQYRTMYGRKGGAGGTTENDKEPPILGGGGGGA